MGTYRTRWRHRVLSILPATSIRGKDAQNAITPYTPTHNVIDLLVLDATYISVTARVVRLQQETFLDDRVRIGWQFSDDEAGVEQMEMQLQAQDGEWQPATWDYTTPTTTEIALNPDYRIKVRARAQDRFGLMSEWVTIELWRATASIYLPIVNR